MANSIAVGVLSSALAGGAIAAAIQDSGSTTSPMQSVLGSPLLLPDIFSGKLPAELIGEHAAIDAALDRLAAQLTAQSKGSLFDDSPTASPKQTPAYLTFADIQLTLDRLAESPYTKALRGEHIGGAVVSPEQFVAGAQGYLTAQSQTPQFVGPLSRLEEVIEVGHRTEGLLTKLTNSDFLGRATAALDDYYGVIRSECDRITAARIRCAGLSEGSLRLGILKGLSVESKEIAEAIGDTTIRLFALPADLFKPIAEAKVKTPLGGGMVIPPEVLLSVILKTGTLQSHIDVSGTYFHKDCPEKGYFVRQQIVWHPAETPAEGSLVPKQLVVGERLITNFADARWTQISEAVDEKSLELQSTTVTENSETKKTVQGPGHVLIKSWIAEGGPEKTLAAFEAQWTSGKYPGFSDEVKREDGIVITSTEPAALRSIFDQWAINEPVAPIPLALIDLNSRAIAAIECELAQKLRTHITEISAPMNETRLLLAMLDSTLNQYGNAAGKSSGNFGVPFPAAELLQSWQFAAKPQAILHDLGERFRIARLGLLELSSRIELGESVVDPALPTALAKTVAHLRSVADAEALGVTQAVNLVLVGIGHNSASDQPLWLPRRQWDELVKHTQKSPMGATPYFSLRDPRTDAPEALDAALGIRPGLSRLMMAYEAAQLLGEDHSQSFFELQRLIRQTGPVQEATTAQRAKLYHPNGTPMGEVLIELTTPSRFGERVDYLLAQGVGELVVVDKAARMTFENLERERVLEDGLWRDLTGDSAWRESGKIGTPTPGPEMQLKINEQLGRESVPVEARLEVYLRLNNRAALTGVLVPLGEIKSVFPALDPKRAIEEFKKAACNTSNVGSLTKPNDQQMVNSRRPLPELGENVRLVLLNRTAEKTGHDLERATAAISMELSQEVLAEEVERLIRSYLTKAMKDGAANSLAGAAKN